MNKREMLKFCTKCSHRAMDRNRGVVCGLTQDEPNFDDHCVDFQEDEKVVRIEKERFDNKKEYPTISYFNTSEYRSVSFYKFGWFVGAMFLLFLLNVFMVNHFRDIPNAPLMLFYASHFSWAAKVIGILFLAKSISSIKHGVLASLFFVGYHFFLANSDIISSLIQGNLYLAPILSLFEIGCVLFLVSFKKLKPIPQLWFIMLSAVIYVGLGMLSQATGVLAKWFDKDIYSDHYFNSIVHSLGLMLRQIASMLLIVVVYFQLANNRKWNDFTLDLNIKNQAHFFLKVVILKLTYLFLMAGIINWILSNFKGIAFSESAIDQNAALFSTFGFVLFSLISLWYIIVYLRKIVLEFFLYEGQSISWMYFLSCIPVLGSLVLMSMQFVKNSNTTEPQIDESKLLVDNRSITLTLGLALLVYLFFAMSSPPALILVVFGVIFYLVLLMFNFGVYFVFVSRILVFIFLVSIVADAIDLRIAEAGFRRLMTLYLIGMIYPFFLHPLFHLKHYQINSYEDVEIAESGQED